MKLAILFLALVAVQSSRQSILIPEENIEENIEQLQIESPQEQQAREDAKALSEWMSTRGAIEETPYEMIVPDYELNEVTEKQSPEFPDHIMQPNPEFMSREHFAKHETMIKETFSELLEVGHFGEDSERIQSLLETATYDDLRSEMKIQVGNAIDSLAVVSKSTESSVNTLFSKAGSKLPPELKRYSNTPKWRPTECWKESYGRGVGKPLSTCRSGEEKNGWLCYPRCRSGYCGVGPVCWTCGGLSKGCPVKCNGWNFWVCKNCGSTRTSTGACRCTAKSYGRGVGKPMVCKSNEERNLALCYPHCRSGYTGVGPVCWGKCAAGLTNCGAFCASSTKHCVISVVDKVLKSAIAGLKIFCTVVSGGACAAATSTASAGAAIKMKDYASRLGMALTALKSLASTNIISGKTYSDATRYFLSLKAAFLFMAVSTFDPTGLIAMANAFAKPLCKNIEKDKIIWSILKFGGF